MKRKTNLFYNTGGDSNFLTFSNYTEAMTGNFVSTNTKLFPSRFLCIHSNKLEGDPDLRSDLIENVLCARYENKLAFLRDSIIESRGASRNNYTIEAELNSLGYLLECLTDWDDSITEIALVGDISEQDFNGTYTDIICVIDTASYKKGILIPNENTDLGTYPYYIDENDPENEINNRLRQRLYGWAYVVTDDDGNLVTKEPFAKTEGKKPVLDNDEGYNLNSKYSTIELADVNSLENTDTNIDTVKFNIIIPLFDIINIDYKTDFVNVSENAPINLVADGVEDKNGIYNPPYVSNVPFGIWFSSLPCIELKRDLVNKKFAQSWSLVIGSQFKPFPYMMDMPNEIDRDNIAGAYMTFAEILKNQNNITDKLNSFQNSLANITDRLNNIEQQLNDCPGLGNNMDNLRMEFLDYKDEVQNIINNFQEQLDSTELRWVNREG